MTEGLSASPESEVDFTDDAPTPIPPGPTIGETISLKRERVRGWLAGSLIGLLVALEAGILALALKVRPFDHDLLALLMAGLLNPVVALVGAVLGFYFGERAGKTTA